DGKDDIIWWLDIDSPIVNVPFQQQQKKRGQSEPSPQLAWRGRLLARGQNFISDLDAGAWLNVAFLRIEQVDGEAALATLPLGLINAYSFGTAKRKGGFGLAIIP